MFRNEYSKIVHPPLPSKTTDRSISLAIHLKNEGYFCFVSRLRSTERGSKCFKGSTLILFQLQKSASESKKVCSRTNRRAWIFAPFEAHRYVVLWSHLLLLFFHSFFPSSSFFIIIIITLSCAAFKYSYRIFDGMETRKNRSSFVFTRREYFEFSNFWEITSFHWNDGFFFSLQTCEGLNLILSYFIYRASYRSNTIFKMAKKKKKRNKNSY